MNLTGIKAKAMGRDWLERLTVELQSEVERLQAENGRLQTIVDIAQQMVDDADDGYDVLAGYQLDKLRVAIGRPDPPIGNPSPSNPSLEARSTGSEL